MGLLFGLPPEGPRVFLKEELKDLKAGIVCSSRSKNTMPGSVQRTRVRAGGEHREEGPGTCLFKGCAGPGQTSINNVLGEWSRHTANCCQQPMYAQDSPQKVRVRAEWTHGGTHPSLGHA